MAVAAMPLVRQPELSRLLAVWEAKRGLRAMPARADFDMLEFREWFGTLLLLDVIDGGGDFHCRLCGTTVAAVFGADATGRRVSALSPERQPVRVDEYAEVCRSKGPLYGARHILRGRRLIATHHLVLPLSCDGGRVDRILAGVSGEPLRAPMPALP